MIELNALPNANITPDVVPVPTPAESRAGNIVGMPNPLTEPAPWAPNGASTTQFEQSSAAATATAPNHRRRGALVRGLSALVAVGAIAGTAAACGNNSNQEADQMCYTQLDPADATAVLQSMPPGAMSQNYNNGNGTQDVCVIQKDGVAHYYGPNDNFNDYLTYRELDNVTAGFADYGIINGGLAPYQSIALTNVVMIRSNGIAYHPFSSTNGEVVRQSNPSNLGGIMVRGAQYGHGTRVAFGTPVKGYGYTGLKNADPQSVALTTTGGSVRRSTVKGVINAPGTNLGARKSQTSQSTHNTPSIPKLSSRSSGRH